MSYDMYQANILDYYKHPRNKGTVKGDLHARELNPLCGDVISISGKVEKDHVVALNYEGTGCAISQAAASMVAEHLEGKTITELKKFSKKDLMEMLGIEISPARLRCALLGLRVLKEALYRHEKMDDAQILDRLTKEGLIL